MYTREDLAGLEHLEYAAGIPPYLRGPYSTMYVMQPWTIRQYAGFSTAEESNAFYRRNLAAGQKGLSVAFDLATHRGYDSDHERVTGDVGKAGVAIDSILDMKILFDQIPLDRMSVSMTMNGAVLPIMAFYIVTAEEQGVALEKLSGTIQNDILKEFMVRNTYIYPPAQSMRIVGDIFRYCAAQMPKFNCISVSGYHMQEAGATADLELAYTLADGLEYLRTGVKAGLSVDDFAPRISFFWGIGMNHFMEIAKMRAARVLWAKIVQRLRTEESEVPCSSRALARPPAGASPRRIPTTMWCAPVLRRWPRPWDIRSRCTPMLSTKHSRCRRSFPHALRATRRSTCSRKPASRASSIRGRGSYYVERLTHELMHSAWKLIEEVEELGGMTKAIETGIPKMRIEEAAARRQANIDSGKDVIVGVNAYRASEEPQIPVLDIDDAAVRAAQIAGCEQLKRDRDPQAVEQALARLESCAVSGERQSAGVRRGCGARARNARRNFVCARKGLGTLRGSHAHHLRRLLRRRRQCAKNSKKRAQMVVEFEQEEGRRPRILVAKMGQDGHDRGAKVIATRVGRHRLRRRYRSAFPDPA